MKSPTARPEIREANPHPQDPIHDASGGPSAWVSVGKPAAANEDRFRHLVDENPAITWTCDYQGRVTYANRRLIEYTGTELNGDVGEWASRAVHPDDLPRRAEE